MAYCTAIHVMFTPRPDPGPLDCKSVTIPSELCGPLNIPAVKYVHKLDYVSNCVVLIIV